MQTSGWQILADGGADQTVVVTLLILALFLVTVLLMIYRHRVSDLSQKNKRLSRLQEDYWHAMRSQDDFWLLVQLDDDDDEAGVVISNRLRGLLRLDHHPKTVTALMDALAPADNHNSGMIKAFEEHVEFLLNCREVETFKSEATFYNEQVFHLKSSTKACSDGRFSRVLWVVNQTDMAKNLKSLQVASDFFSQMERLTKQAIDMLPCPVWFSSRSGQLLWANQCYLSIVGEETLDDALTKNSDLLNRSIEVRAAIAKQCMESREIRQEAVKMVLNGKRRQMQLIEVAGQNQANEQEAALLLGVAFDISDFSDLSHRLDNLKRSQAITLNALSSAVVIFSSDQRLEFYNQAVMDIFKLDYKWLETRPTHSELLNRLRDARQLPEKKDFNAWKTKVLDDYKNLVEPKVSLLYLPDDKVLRIAASPYLDGGLIFVMDDVTDKIALERSYNTSLAVQRETLNNLQEGVALIASNGEIELYNLNFAEMWNLDTDQVGQKVLLRDVFDANAEQLALKDMDHESQYQQLLAVLSSRESAQQIWSMADGRTLQLVSVPLPDGACLLTFLDMTDTANRALALKQRAQALEVADKIKSEFVANVSYELRTPLNTIIGFTELLEQQYFGPVTDKQKEYLGSILQASDSLKQLIDNILDLAVLEAGKLTLEIGPCQINELLEQVKNLAQEKARQASITLDFDVAEDLGTIQVDQRRISHAVYNMITSAIDLTSPGGEIIVEAVEEDDMIRVSVIDDSMSLPASSALNLFRSFINLEDDGGRKHKMGMGLSLVKSFVEFHGGHVDVDSAPEMGTKVIAYIPKHAKQPSDQQLSID